MKKIVMLVLSVALCALVAMEAPMSAQAAVSTGNDFSRPGDVGYSTAYAADVLEQYLGTPLGETERAYLAAQNNFELHYSAAIGASYVTTEFPEGADAGKLTISARPYSYTASNRTVISWTPKHAFLDGEDFAYTAGAWTTDVTPTSGDAITVEYEATLPINAREVNSFLNTAYVAGMGASEKLTAERARYEGEMADYEEARALYERYLADLMNYEAQSAAYERYTVEYREWAEKNRLYTKYLADLAQYQKEKAAFDNYGAALQAYYADLARYQQYLTDLEIYAEKVVQYEKDTASPAAQTALYQLSILKYLTKPVTSLNRTVSSAILGNSVTQVLAQTEALVLAGAERAAVNRANNATIVLRDLLTRYDELTTDEQRYMFYITCYEQLRDNFSALLRTLDYFYDYDLVRMELKRRDRVEQYEILLAQLYYLCNALDNNPVGNYIHEYKTNKTGAYFYDSTYRIGSSKRTPAAVVGADGVLEDKNDALPLESGYPNLPAEPVLPTPVADPGNPPAQPRDPGAPPPLVENPGPAPKVVEMPTMPEKVVEPTAPTAYKPTEMESALAAAFERGELKERPLLERQFSFLIKTQVVKYFRNAQVVTVYFHLDRDAPLSDYAYMVESAHIGSYVTYEGKQPKAEQREGYECVFDGWMDGAGNLIDLNRLTLPEGTSGDLHLYPHFNEIPVSCTVVWSVDGSVYYGTCAYGAQPTYDEEAFGALVKVRAGVRLYRFVGWKNGDSTYTAEELPLMAAKIVAYSAIFEESYVVNWSIAGNVVRAPVWKGEIPEYGEIPEKPTDSYYSYTFSGWDRPIVPAVGDVTYTALFNAEYLVGFAGGGSIVAWSEEVGAYTARVTNVGESPVFCAGLFELAASKNAGVVVAFSGGTISFSIASVRTVSASSMQKLTISVLQTGTDCYCFALEFADEAGSKVPLDCSVQITAFGAFDAENSYLIGTDGAGNTSEVNSGVFVTENEVSFTMTPGILYELYPQYAVGIMPMEQLEIFASRNRAGAGERVELTFGTLPTGTFIRSVFIRAENGEDIAFDGTGFIMPACAVTVGVGLDWIEYSIVFKSEGKTLVTRILPYGAEILPPPDPVKASDDTYEYTFTGWDKPLGTVTGDMEFNAVFTESPLPEQIFEETTLTKIIRFAYVAVPIYLAILVAIIALLVVLRIRKNILIAKSNVATVPVEEVQTPKGELIAPACEEESYQEDFTAIDYPNEPHVPYPQCDMSAEPAPMYGIDGDFSDPAPSEAVPDPLVVAAFPKTEEVLEAQEAQDAPKSSEE